MSDKVEVRWDNEEKTVVLQAFQPGFTVADWREAARLSSELLSSVDHVVDLIIDFGGGEVPPAMLTGRRFVESVVPPNQGLLVLVNPTALLEKMVDVMQKLSPKIAHDAHFVPSVDVARALIAAKRQGS